jgi:hypothetical protein
VKRKYQAAIWKRDLSALIAEAKFSISQEARQKKLKQNKQNG